jgi:hypothetical protein
MDAAAKHVMKTYPEVAMAFGESDEYRYALNIIYSIGSNGLAAGYMCSFLLRKPCNLYNRRSRFTLQRVFKSCPDQ